MTLEDTEMTPLMKDLYKNSEQRFHTFLEDSFWRCENLSTFDTVFVICHPPLKLITQIMMVAGFDKAGMITAISRVWDREERKFKQMSK